MCSQKPERVLLIGLLSTSIFFGSNAIGAQGQNGIETLHTVNWNNNHAGIGQAVAGLGDLNGDGMPDFIVGAPSLYFLGNSDPGAAVVFSGATGDVLFSYLGLNNDDGYGYSVADAGDVNADGTPDFIIGAPHANTAIFDCGQATIYSGATGAMLMAFGGTANGAGFGTSVDGVGDINADGYADFIIGSPDTNLGGFTQSGYAKVYSGYDGSTLYLVEGIEDYEYLGQCVSGVGDFDKDGTPDFAIGSPGATGTQLNDGRVSVYSGADGSVLFSFTGTHSSNKAIGTSIDSAGDFNGDGFNDFIVGGHRGGANFGGQAIVFFGPDGSDPPMIFDGDWDTNFGFSVCGIGDQNGDGFDDVAIGASLDSYAGAGDGAVYIYLGGSNSLMHKLNSPDGRFRFGFSVSRLDDLTGNGLPQLVIGSPDLVSSAGRLASASVIAFNPYLSVDSNLVSSSAGALLGLQLDFPDATAGDEYRVLFSTSEPGTFHHGVDIPLGLDAFVIQSYFGNYPFHMSANLQGTLNANGDAGAVIAYTPGSHSAHIGLTIYFSAITIDAGYLPGFSAAPVPVTIVP
jgi:hypothetical protein